MNITIKKVQTRSDLKAFVGFPLELYKGCPYYVPSIFSDDMDTFTPSKNPAYKFSQTALFLAYKDDKIVGRVAAIINNKANQTWNHKEVRYGWFDFIDDKEVSKALIDAVIGFGKENGMETITGPLGFIDFDPEGMLVEGFDHISTAFLKHNYPYYKDHMEEMGFEKEIDWLEFKIYLPEVTPERYTRLSGIVAKRYNLHLRKITRREVFGKEKMGLKIINLINDTYSKLYNYTSLPDDLITKLVKSYLSFLDLKYIACVENENNELVGVGITMPSIARALQKCGGKIFPFGWWHVAKSMFIKREENFELLLIGIADAYKNKGVHAIIFNDIIPRAIAEGFKWAETNAELETNLNVQALWDCMDYEQTKRRRIYFKKI